MKELEHLLQTLEAQKLQILQPAGVGGLNVNEDTTGTVSKFMPPPFAQFFAYPQYTWSQIPNKYTSKTKAAIADIEVTLIETHANLRILWRKSPRQLSKLVAGFQTLHLTILHLNVTTMDPLVLYSISAKVINYIVAKCFFILSFLKKKKKKFIINSIFLTSLVWNKNLEPYIVLEDGIELYPVISMHSNFRVHVLFNTVLNLNKVN